MADDVVGEAALCRRGGQRADVVAAGGNQVCADDNDMDIAAAVAWCGSLPGLPQRATKARLEIAEDSLIISFVSSVDQKIN